MKKIVMIVSFLLWGMSFMVLALTSAMYLFDFLSKLYEEKLPLLKEKSLKRQKED
ncbi:MAG: hypothetical protein GX345_06720 [Clostridiales bacterium]|nr:hypothetical protein [Clostridiales bacterium]